MPADGGGGTGCTLCTIETLSAAVHCVYRRDRPDLGQTGPVSYSGTAVAAEFDGSSAPAAAFG